MSKSLINFTDAFLVEALEKAYDKSSLFLIPDIMWHLLENDRRPELIKLTETICSENQSKIDSSSRIELIIEQLSKIFCEKLDGFQTSLLHSFIMVSVRVLTVGLIDMTNNIDGFIQAPFTRKFQSFGDQKLCITSEYALMLLRSYPFFSNIADLNKASQMLIDSISERTMMECWPDVYLSLDSTIKPPL